MVDSRILEMVFKNKEFEDGVNDSIKSLDKLDRSLGKVDGTDTSTALDKVGNVAEQVGKKFSIFEEMAIGALRRIGERAADWGISMAKSLSIDQLTEGWSKYEQKNTAMQTIINNAHDENGNAYSLEQVNAQMEKLNWFTDETSYNFTDMVNNIGKFTAMGKSLEDSTTAMEGISLWAASAGQGITQASSAMYNLAQAMGMGALTNIDFKSIENANMATEEFRIQAMESGVAMEMLTKKYDEAAQKWRYYTKKGTEVTTESFRNTLSEKWLNSYVLMDTLKEYGKFTDELHALSEKTGMSATDLVSSNKGLLDQYADATDKIAFLNEYLEENRVEFEDENFTVEELAKSLDKLNSAEYALSKKAFRMGQEYRTLNDAISATKDAVSTGWMNIFEAVIGDYEKAKEVWTQFGDDLYEIFGRGTKKILDILLAWRELEEFGETLGTRSALFKSLHILVATLFDVDYRFTSIAKIIHDAWDEIFPSSVEESALKLANVIIWFSDKVQTFQDFVTRNADSIKGIFKGIFGLVKVAKTILIAPFKALTKIVGAFTDGAGDSFVTILGKIGNGIYELSEKFSSKFEGFFDGFANGVLRIKELFNEIMNPSGLKSAIGDFGTAFDQFKNGDFAQGIATALAYSVSRVKDFIDALKDLKNVWAEISEMGEGLGRDFDMSDVKAETQPIRKAFIVLQMVIQKMAKAFDKAKETFFKMVDAVKKSKSGLSGVFTKPIKIGKIFEKVIEAIGNAFEKVAEKIKSLKKSEGPFKKIATFFKNIGKLISAIWQVIKEALGGIIDKFNSFMDVHTVTDLAELLRTIFKLLKTGGLVAIIGKIISMLKKSNKTIDTVKDGLKKLFGSLSGLVEDWRKSKKVDIFKQIATSLLMLSVALLILAKIDTLKLAAGIGAMAAMLFIINKFVNNLGDLTDPKKLAQYLAASKLISKIGIAMLFLALAVKVMGSLELDTLVKGVGGIAALFLVISIFMKSLQKVDPVAVQSTGTMLTKMALAIRILIWSVERLGKMSLKDLAKGLGGIAALMLMMGLFIKSVSNSAFLTGDDLKKTGTMMIMMAGAMLLFSIAVKRMGQLKAKTLAKGLIAIGAIFLEIGMFMKLLKKTGNITSTAWSIILLATAMNIMYFAVKNFGDMPVENVVQGLIATGAALAEFVLALKFIDGEDVIAKAGAIAIIAAAMLLLVPAVEAFGAMKIEDVATALLMIAGIMAIFVVAMYALEPLAPVLITVAGAFALFGLGILAVGAGILLLSMALLVLIPVAGEAVALIGAIIAAIIAGIPGFIAAVGAGIVALIGVIAASAASIVAAIVLIVSEILLGLTTLAPQLFELLNVIIGGVLELLLEYTPPFLEWLGMLVAGLLEILVANTPAFMLWLDEIVLGLMQILLDLTPKLFEWLNQILDGLFSILEEYIPRLFELINTIIYGVIDLLLNAIPDLVDAGLEMLSSILHSIDDHMEDVVATALSIVSNFLLGIADGIPDVIDSGFKVVIAFINGMADAIRNNNEDLYSAIDNLLESVIEAIVNFFMHSWKTIKQAGKDLMQSGFIQGMKDKIEKVKEVVSDIVEKIKKWFKEKWESMKDIGKNLVDGLSEGLKSKWDDLKNNVTETAGKVTGWFKNVFGINSPSRVFAEIGRYNMMGLAKGFTDNERLTETAAERVGEDTMDAFGRAMADVYDSIDGNMDMSPTITPVLDLSQIQNGGRYLGSMFGDARVGVTANAYNASVQARAAAQAQDNANLASALKYYTDRMVSALKSQSGDTNVNVTLEGDAAKLFKAIRTENDKYRASTGRSALV